MRGYATENCPTHCWTRAFESKRRRCGLVSFFMGRDVFLQFARPIKHCAGLCRANVLDKADMYTS
eukprot:365732-Chlamydomonas_euryale.AAC.6